MDKLFAIDARARDETDGSRRASSLCARRKLRLCSNKIRDHILATEQDGVAQERGR